MEACLRQRPPFQGLTDLPLPRNKFQDWTESRNRPWRQQRDCSQDLRKSNKKRSWVSLLGLWFGMLTSLMQCHHRLKHPTEAQSKNEKCMNNFWIQRCNSENHPPPAHKLLPVGVPHVVIINLCSVSPCSWNAHLQITLLNSDQVSPGSPSSCQPLEQSSSLNLRQKN